jgi:uncharacterized membrane protein
MGENPPQGAVARPRLDSVDMLRGLIMVLMALDHVRDFFGDLSFNAIDPRSRTDVATYFTRWISHFCAPNFVFLTGVGAYLYGSRGRTTGQTSWYLLSRGSWLIVFEAVILTPMWRQGDVFDKISGAYTIFGQVFWAIGASMVVLSLVVWLPRAAILLFALLLIEGHNIFDVLEQDPVRGISLPGDFGVWNQLWYTLHVPDYQGNVRLGDWIILNTGYPLIPWIGVMAAGYCFGPVLRMDKAERRTWTLGLGALLTVGFFVLRATNVYGDPFPWSLQKNETFTVLSFLNCHKYPPSLCYLMMTIGPALLLLAAFEWHWRPVGPILTVYGRVPMFYYLLHLPLIIGLMYLTVNIQVRRGLYESMDELRKGGGLKFDLPTVYMVWLVVITILYFPCLWYSGVKSRSKSAWLTYL